MHEPFTTLHLNHRQHISTTIMVLSMDRWVGKVAIVTGASVGIGANIADHLVERGLIVVGLARRYELIEKRSKELSGKKGKLYAIKTDITKEDQILRAFKWVEDNLGHVHILINNAGVFEETLLYNGNTDLWKNTLEVNILGMCICTREAVQIMIANNIKGHIIQVNSIGGHKVPNFPGTNVYCATKHAVTALAGTLKQELDAIGNEIKVTSLSPGLVVSEMTTLNKKGSPKRQALMNSHPILQPEDISEAVCYILSTAENVQIPELTITPMGEPS